MLEYENSRMAASLETIQLNTNMSKEEVQLSLVYKMSDTLIALYCVCDKVFQEKSILRFFLLFTLIKVQTFALGGIKVLFLLSPFFVKP